MKIFFPLLFHWGNTLMSLKTQTDCAQPHHCILLALFCLKQKTATKNKQANKHRFQVDEETLIKQTELMGRQGSPNTLDNRLFSSCNNLCSLSVPTFTCRKRESCSLPPAVLLYSQGQSTKFNTCFKKERLKFIFLPSRFSKSTFFHNNSLRSLHI